MGTPDSSLSQQTPTAHLPHAQLFEADLPSTGSSGARMACKSVCVYVCVRNGFFSLRTYPNLYLSSFLNATIKEKRTNRISSTANIDLTL